MLITAMLPVSVKTPVAFSGTVGSTPGVPITNGTSRLVLVPLNVSVPVAGPDEQAAAAITIAMAAPKAVSIGLI
jgi:hypothetical protein